MDFQARIEANIDGKGHAYFSSQPSQVSFFLQICLNALLLKSDQVTVGISTTQPPLTFYMKVSIVGHSYEL
jgi:hypothetical protein